MGKSPDAFRTISEAAGELGLPQHVLRFWETRFAQIKPLKRGGGRRYYRPGDVSLLKGVRYLLYDQGFTIKGVQRILRQQGPRHVVAIGEARSLDVPKSGEGAATAPAGPEPGEARQGVDSETGAPAAAATAITPVTAPAGQKISPKGRQKLAEIMRELLECKRALDNAREG